MRLDRFILACAFCIVTLGSEAQDRSVSVGISAHAINFSTSKYFQDWQWGFTKVSLGIPIAERFTISPGFAFGKANTNGLEKTSYWDMDASLQYALTKTKIQPYLTVGGGANHFEEKTYGTFNGGLGLNVWIIEGVALNAQTTFDATPSFNNYWHHSIGLIFNIGGGGANAGSGTKPVGRSKDSDKDGISDDLDVCPMVKGMASAKGCPDVDGDGVQDSADACINEFGTASTNGCPDSDGDGFANAEDSCPTVKGALKGCPDADGDGIADKDDACPTQKGIAQFNGCPDTDGDGIADGNDKCPTVKGTVANQGCLDPDGDSDGVSDALDKCPTVAGSASNNGCPEMKAEEVKQLEDQINLAAKLIQFETSKAVIRPVSFKEIDAIIAIMNQYAWTRFRIEGHTDNIGDAAKNQALSDARAKAVKDYMVSKGIGAARLDAEGFGSQKPKASNATVEGRTQNRRVEIHLAK